MNGESDAAGYSSEEDSRYPPQMALTPIPGSPVPPEDCNHNNPTRPPILPRFSFEVCFNMVRLTLVVNYFTGPVCVRYYDFTHNMSNKFLFRTVSSGRVRFK